MARACVTVTAAQKVGTVLCSRIACFSTCCIPRERVVTLYLISHTHTQELHCSCTTAGILSPRIVSSNYPEIGEPPFRCDEKKKRSVFQCSAQN